MHFEWTIFVIISFIPKRQADTTCTSPFYWHPSGHCILVNQNALEYCEAQTSCYLEGYVKGGRGFIAGRIYTEVDNLGCNNCWTGLHRLFWNMTAKPDQWLMSDGGKKAHIIDEADLTKFYGPSGARILAYTSSLLYKIQQRKNNKFQKAGVVCEVEDIGKVNQLPSIEKFRQEAFDHNDVTAFEFPGCPVLRPAKTEIQCAMRCKLMKTCRAFYFNHQDKICIICEYVDSNLEQFTSGDGTWKRFKRADRD